MIQRWNVTRQLKFNRKQIALKLTLEIADFLMTFGEQFEISKASPAEFCAFFVVKRHASIDGKTLLDPVAEGRFQWTGFTAVIEHELSQLDQKYSHRRTNINNVPRGNFSAHFLPNFFESRCIRRHHYTNIYIVIQDIYFCPFLIKKNTHSDLWRNIA